MCSVYKWVLLYVKNSYLYYKWNQHRKRPQYVKCITFGLENYNYVWVSVCMCKYIYWFNFPMVRRLFMYFVFLLTISEHINDYFAEKALLQQAPPAAEGASSVVTYTVIGAVAASAINAAIFLGLVLRCVHRRRHQQSMETDAAVINGGFVRNPSFSSLSSSTGSVVSGSDRGADMLY